VPDQRRHQHRADTPVGDDLGTNRLPRGRFDGGIGNRRRQRPFTNGRGIQIGVQGDVLAVLRGCRVAVTDQHQVFARVLVARHVAHELPCPAAPAMHDMQNHRFAVAARPPCGLIGARGDALGQRRHRQRQRRIVGQTVAGSSSGDIQAGQQRAAQAIGHAIIPLQRIGQRHAGPPPTQAATRQRAVKQGMVSQQPAQLRLLAVRTGRARCGASQSPKSHQIRRQWRLRSSSAATSHRAATHRR